MGEYQASIKIAADILKSTTNVVSNGNKKYK
jgi:hypothetical protein